MLGVYAISNETSRTFMSDINKAAQNLGFLLIILVGILVAASFIAVINAYKEMLQEQSLERVHARIERKLR